MAAIKVSGVASIPWSGFPMNCDAHESPLKVRTGEKPAKPVDPQPSLQSLLERLPDPELTFQEDDLASMFILL